MRIRLIALFLAALTVAACSKTDAQKSADALLNQAKYDFEHGRYEMALASIDSLRKIYPSAIEVRRKALELYQVISLKQAQEELEKTDILLQQARSDYEYVREEVQKRRNELTATAEQLEAVTLMRIKVDSLQTQFDVQCAKIKYIHKRQKMDN